MLTLEEAASLAAALDDLVTHITLDTPAREWSKQTVDLLIAPTSDPA